MYERPSCFCACTPTCADGCTSIGGSVKRSSVRPSFASTRSSIPSTPMSSTMNFSRAFTRDMRYFRSSLQTDVIAPRISFDSSVGTNTPRSRAMRGTDASPPPTSTAKPSRPSLTTPTSEMQLISGALQRSGQLAIEYLCLRGRFAHAGLP